MTSAPQAPFRLVFCTAPSQEVASKLAELLVEKQLAACVTALPEASSVYSWQGKIERSTEILLLIKTEQRLINKLFDELTKVHPYDCPELISVPIEKASAAYGTWLASNLAPPDQGS